MSQQQSYEESNLIGQYQQSQRDGNYIKILKQNRIVKTIIIIILLLVTLQLIRQYYLKIYRKETNPNNGCVQLILQNAFIQGYKSVQQKLVKQDPSLKAISEKIQYYKRQQLKIDAYSLQAAGITQQKIDKASRLRDIIYNPENKVLTLDEYQTYETKYGISQYKQLPFCVFVSSYNNEKAKVYERNLISILQQNYTNYRVIYIDDASTDRTFELVTQFLESHPLKQKVKLIRNPYNMGVPRNFITAANQHCQSNEIFFRVDGDDQIIGKQSLKLFNSFYHTTDAWAIYSSPIYFICNQFRHHFGRPFFHETIQNNDYRYVGFPFFAQVSYYTQLLRKIKDEDIKWKNGSYYRNSGDAAVAWPILEMSGRRVHYIPEITYYYNVNIGLHDSSNAQTSKLQGIVSAELKFRKKYEPLKTLFEKLKS